MNSFTPAAKSVAHGAYDFARKMHYSIAGREHMLYSFATGAFDKKSKLHNETIRRAFESCGLTPKVVRTAIVDVDGGMRPRKPHRVYQDPTMHLPSTVGIETLIMEQIFVGLTSNADTVFKMAREDVGEDELVHAEDVLRIFLREVDRSEEVGRKHRVVDVLESAMPGLTLADIKFAMLESLDVTIANSPTITVAKLEQVRLAFDGLNVA